MSVRNTPVSLPSSSIVPLIPSPAKQQPSDQRKPAECYNPDVYALSSGAADSSIKVLPHCLDSIGLNSTRRCHTVRLTFKLCVMVYRCLHGIGPEYFSEDFRLVSEIYSRLLLRSTSSTDVVVPATRRSSLGDRAFPVAGARAWNALPPSVTSAPSLSSFRRLLKTFLFQRQRRQ